MTRSPVVTLVLDRDRANLETALHPAAWHAPQDVLEALEAAVAEGLRRFDEGAAAVLVQARAGAERWVRSVPLEGPVASMWMVADA